MKTCTVHCKFCEKKYEEKSKWIPEDILGLIIEIKHFLHVIKYHRKECNFKKLFKAFLGISLDLLKCIGICLLILIKIILYPLYLLLDLLY